MSLMPIYFSTTKTSRHKKVRKTAGAIKLQREIDELKRKNGYIVSKSHSYIAPKDIEQMRIGVPAMSHSIPVGLASKSKQKQYSGERKLIGIATLHKSNMVPVFSKEDATEISRMRRG